MIVFHVVTLAAFASIVAVFHAIRKNQQTKKIQELKWQIHKQNHHIVRSALVERANLPPCKSVACYNCKFCTFLYHPTNGALYLLGCGKDIRCDNFVYTGTNKPDPKERFDCINYNSPLLQSEFFVDAYAESLQARVPPFDCFEQDSMKGGGENG